MAINTKVQADHNAPPITRMLAEFAIQHPSQGWDWFVEHAIGSLERPMSAEQLKAKFTDQAAAEIGDEKAEAAWSAAMGLGIAPDVKALLAAATRP